VLAKAQLPPTSETLSFRRSLRSRRFERPPATQVDPTAFSLDPLSTLFLKLFPCLRYKARVFVPFRLSFSETITFAAHPSPPPSWPAPASVHLLSDDTLRRAVLWVSLKHVSPLGNSHVLADPPLALASCLLPARALRSGQGP